MMKSLCGTDCCSRCSPQAECGGCQSVKEHPFGGNCIAAECVKQSGEEGFQRREEKDALELSQIRITYWCVNTVAMGWIRKLFCIKNVEGTVCIQLAAPSDFSGNQ